MTNYMNGTNDLSIMDRGIEVKETIGSFKIFDDIDPIDHSAVYQFIKIVYNYLKMKNILNNDKES